MQKISVSGIMILGLVFLLAGNVINMLSADYVFIGIALIYIAIVIMLVAGVVSANQISLQNKLREERLKRLEYEVSQLKKKIKTV